MAYSKEELEKKALAAIKRHKLKFISHVVAFLPCSERTLFNQELHELQSIKSAIEQNKISAKAKTLNKWEKSDNATLQIAFYKLIGDDDEVHRLNGSKQELKTSVEGSFIKDLVKNINQIEGNDSDISGNSND